MSATTNIQWCDSTVSPTTGCGAGCELWNPTSGGTCYAAKLHESRMAVVLPDLYAPSFGEVRLAPGRIRKAAAWSDMRGTDRPDKPWLNGLPRVIFIGDMADVLSHDVPFDYLRNEVIEPICSPKGQRHLWMLLTKQSRRLVEFDQWLQNRGVAWPANLAAGVSVTRQPTARRVVDLIQTRARYRFVSMEPMLADVDLAHFVEPSESAWDEVNAREAVEGCDEPEEFIEECEAEGDWVNFGSDLVPNPEHTEWKIARRDQAKWFTFRNGINMVIVGGESGKDARPFDLEWLRTMVRNTKGERAPALFVKQLGSHPVSGGERINLKDSHGGDWSEWSEDLRVRRFMEVRP